jgi:HPt (histidine-containing phosphotransfer) domain-containing protein
VRPGDADSPEAAPALVDWKAALHHTAGDREMLLALAELFQTESPGMLAELRAALDARDPPRLARAAHSLKSSFGYFAARQAVECAESLERCGKEHRFDVAAGLVEQLADHVRRITPELAAFQRGWS